MRFLGTLVSWLIASGITYICAAIASQTMVLNELSKMLEMSGDTLAFSERLSSTAESVAGMWMLWPVIAIGFAVAFFVASLLKALIPILAPIAFPLAGGAAMAAIVPLIPALAIIELQGATTLVGLGLQVLSGVVGGCAFMRFGPS